MINEQNVSYNGNPNVKRDGVKQPWSEEQLQEYVKCSFDPIYFIKKYVKIISLDEGLVPFKLYDYQEKMVNHMNDNRFSIVLSCRQSGKTISVISYILWFALFNPAKTIFLLANKGETARDVLFARFTLALENVPFFLQPGTKVLNKGSIEFSNNTKVFARATSSSSIRGSSADCIVLDELAFVERSEEFYTSTFPVISSGKNSKILISSTPNGIGNLFHRLWVGATTGTNEFKPFTINWWDVPGRDEEWKQKVIANTSQRQFDQEFNINFLGSSNTLIDGNKLLSLSASEPILTRDEGCIRIYKEPEETHDYVMTVDVSKGRGQDYSTFNIIDVSSKPFEQVAVFQNNMVSPLIFPLTITKYAKLYNDAYVIVENNDNGVVVANAILYDFDYDNLYIEMKVGKTSVGIQMDKKIKAQGCSNLKDIVEENKLKLHDRETISELCTFIAKGRSFQAEQGSHDDLVMNLVLFAWFTNTNLFDDFSDTDLRTRLYQQQMKQMEEDLLPFGVIETGEERKEKDRYDHFGGVMWERDESLL